jgi:SAM-dependent methyltransferase
VLTSTHKIVGSLTQSAMLHVAATGRVDIGAVGRAMRLVRSTSPSSLLLASLDAARRQLAVHGEAILHDTLATIRRTTEKLAAVPGLRVLGEDLVGRPGVAAWDPLRIVLDVRGTGRSGYDVADALRQAYDVQPELATHATIVLVVGAGERPEALERVAGDIDETVKRISRPGASEALVAPQAALELEMAVPPREAFLGRAEELPVDDATADVVISNGVCNLSPDKEAVFREIARVLKPGGRIQIADIVVQRAVPDAAKENIDLWTG